MAATPLKSTADAVNQAPAKKSKKKLFILLAVVGSLVASGVGGWYYYNQQDGHAHEKKAEPEKPPIFVTMDTFTVNLQPQDGNDQFLQVAMTIQVGSEPEAEALKVYAPQLRSRILMLLSSKKSGDLIPAEGKKKLTEDLKALLSQPLTPHGTPQRIKDVYFTSFVIQ